MSFGEIAINLQSLQRCPLLFLEGLLWGQQTAASKEGVRSRQPGISRRVIRVVLDCLLEVIHAFLKSLFRPRTPEITSHHVKLVSLAILGVALGQPLLLLAAQAQPQLLRYFLRNLRLHRHDVRQFAVILPTPQMPVVSHIYQLSADRNIIATLNEPAH